MNKKVLLIIGSLLVLVVVGFLLTMNRYNWMENYSYKSKHPYNTKFIYELLTLKYGEDNHQLLDEPFDSVFNNLDSNATYDYVKIDYFRRFDSSEYVSLFKFVEQGNNAFFSTVYNEQLLDTLLNNSCKKWCWPKSFYSLKDSAAIENINIHTSKTDTNYYVLDSAKIEEEGTRPHYMKENPDSEGSDDYYYDDDFSFDSIYHVKRGYWCRDYLEYNYEEQLALNFELEADRTDSNYIFPYFFRVDTLSSYWVSIKEQCICDAEATASVEVLGRTDKEKVYFIRVNYGKGAFYIHTEPLTFTNAQIIDARRLEYAEKITAHLDNEQLLWDLYRERYSMFEWDMVDNDSSTPLSYMLSQRAFKWAIYLTVFATLLFMFFRAKRKQQFIPVIEPNTNTSLEYVEMMAQLYYKEQDHHFIANELWRKFVDYVRKHYYIQVNDADKKWIEKLSKKSDISEAKLNGILTAYEKTKFEIISAEELYNLYEKLGYFYKNAQ